ncbi:MAG: NADPH:quinone oxidoreductase family protein [Woeseiaceae bacterium]|nr:NADPH:quinone oxidoreductase family protein [Woeseiaceae bacterium]
MKALLCKEYGPPDKLVVEEIPPPSPADDEVLIRVRACGVNYPDNLVIAGKYQVKPPLPFSPGMELAGEIIETGRAVNGLRRGQRVAATPLVGGMAEQVCVPARAVVPIPDNMEFETAAGFIITYGTSYHALTQRARLGATEKLLVLGAGGGVGLTAVEIGSLLGAEVFAAASSQEKLALARERGAEHLIDYSQRSLKEQVKELTDGQGVDVIYDPVGGELFDDCLRSIAWRGRILVVGFASGEIPKIPANLTLLKGSSVVGVFWGAFVEREPDANRDNMQTLLTWYQSAKLNPCIAANYALADAPKAMQALLERRAAGKLVVTM